MKFSHKAFLAVSEFVHLAGMATFLACYVRVCVRVFVCVCVCACMCVCLRVHESLCTGPARSYWFLCARSDAGDHA